MSRVSIILPAHNEADSLRTLLPVLIEQHPESEIIVVDDGSNDATNAIVTNCKVKLVTHPYCIGNGAAIKSGARAASGDILVFMDADGQHNPADISRLVEQLEQGYDMVVGARSRGSKQSLVRFIANAIYNRFASLMTGVPILDLTSGFRAVRAPKFRKFLYLLPNGFSYPTTSTMAFLRCGYSVCYVPIQSAARIGSSKIRLIHDGIRFSVIILRIGALFSPMRLFLPISFMLLVTGLSYYMYTFIFFNRFTNMSALLLTSSLLTFLIGIVSEQISSLHYQRIDEDSLPGKKD